MKKSPVAGVAGAARIDQLSMAELTHAELHGKRMDRTGKSRAINNEPPVTTTGLDLNDLFRAHVADAFVPRARAKAMQVIVQFPKELVDGDDAALMLHHARAFTEKVFGPDAIFADRVDRDEEGRHVVDLFIAPKYVKKTKRDEKVAVSVSRHQKELAEKYKCPPTPIGTGRALQQALFEYLRDDMGLVGVKRGEPKMIPGPDWKASEQLRVEELDAREEELAASIADVARQKAALDGAEVDGARRAADRDSALVDRERRAADREHDLALLAAAAIKREETLGRREAEVRALAEAGQANIIATVADLARRAAAMADDETGLARRIGDADRRERALAAQEREIAAARLKAAQEEAAATAARAEAERLTDERRRAETSARIARDLAIRDAEAAKEERVKAERAREAIAAQQAAIDERQRQAERDRALESGQLALLARAADDDEKLGLQEMASSFWMNEQAMSAGEQAVYNRHWPAPLIAMARHLARALERVREIARRLVAREERIAASEAALAAREQDAARRLAEREDEQHQRHGERLAELDARDRALADDEARVHREAADATALVAAADRTRATAKATLDGVEQWTRVLDTLARFPGVVEYDGTGAITLDHDDRQRLPAWFVATVDTTPPAWASTAIAARHRADAATEQAQQRERVAANAVVELDNLIGRAGPVMTPAQEAFAAEARRTTAPWMSAVRHGSGRSG